MRRFLGSLIARVGRVFQLTSPSLRGPSFPTPYSGMGGTGLLDAYKRLREPTPYDLLHELKNIAWTCASLNASACAAFPPRLYVKTHAGQQEARCHKRKLPWGHPLQRSLSQDMLIEEVTDHPLLALLQQVNHTHNAHDLWELTTLYQEVHGIAYWYLEDGPLGIPEAIYPLATQCLRPVRVQGSSQAIDYYEYRQGSSREVFRPEEVIVFRYPDPRDPYNGGLAPLRACYESMALNSIFLAYKRSVWDNAAMPGVVISPTEVISPEERDRLEQEWISRFRRGGNGKVMVSDTGLNVSQVQIALGDIAALAEAGATQSDIANAFGVPQAFLSTDTNLANLQAAEHQHTSKAIRPRLIRRDEKLNERLIPRYDPTGRLFLMADNPVPEDREAKRAQEKQDLDTGVRTINEVRRERGLPEVEWGHRPWLPVALAPDDFPSREDIVTDQGRGRKGIRKQEEEGKP